MKELQVGIYSFNRNRKKKNVNTMERGGVLVSRPRKKKKPHKNRRKY